MTTETCAECTKVAVSNCAICGKPLCQDHIKHGLSKRTNAPAVNFFKVVFIFSVLTVCNFVSVYVFIDFKLVQRLHGYL